MTDIALEERDELVAEAIAAGRSLRAVRREFSLSQADLDGVLERLWPVDHAARVRMIKRDVGRLEALMAPFYERAVRDGDVPSGVLVVKVYERLHTLVGAEAAQRVDLTIQPKEAPRSFDKIREAVFRVARGPDWRSGQLEPPAIEGNGNGHASEPK